LKVCDLTQFYSPLSGGVKRYVAEKVRYVREHTAQDEHVLIIPGERDERSGDERARTYTIASPLISRTSRYRALLRLEAIERILEKEKPDIIECGDPYQVAWKAIHSGQALQIPVVGFYHSHFPEAYLRTIDRYLGATVTEAFIDLARRYIRALYNRFSRTIVPSPVLCEVLEEWGVRNTFHSDLGVDTRTFQPRPREGEDVRAEFGIRSESMLLLYVGRLAQEKNTHTLFEAFRKLSSEKPGCYHLLVVGDGLQRAELSELSQGALRSAITHLPYCDDADRLASFYRAADLFIHPGVQETFGLVSLEAQSCGTPVIGIAGSYMDRIIHNDQAFWARKNTPEALATAIAEASHADLKCSASSLHEQIARRYSWERTFERLFALYRTVIRETSR
jgi:alpha-1,6-mannosyltransferase